jgi:hypothetical protein
LAPIFAAKRSIHDSDGVSLDTADTVPLHAGRRAKSEFSLPRGLQEYSVLKCIEQYYYHGLYNDPIRVDSTVKADHMKCINKVMTYMQQLAKRTSKGLEALEAVKSKETDTTHPTHAISEETRKGAHVTLGEIIFNHLRCEEFKHFPNLFKRNSKLKFETLESLCNIDNYMYTKPPMETISVTALRIKKLVPDQKLYESTRKINSKEYNNSLGGTLTILLEKNEKWKIPVAERSTK